MQTNNSIYLILIASFYPLVVFIAFQFKSFLINKAKADKEFRNELMAHIYMIIALAPNIAAFSVVSIVTVNDNETITTLLIILVISLLTLRYGRKMRNYVYKQIKKDYIGVKKSDIEEILKKEQYEKINKS